MSVNFEDIRKANETIQTTGIEHKDKKGNVIVKEYAEVNQRIKAFRMNYPEGFIHTEMVSNENGICVFRAKVGFEDEKGHHVLATGTAYEKETSSFINKTSYIENCETSAVGRALGLAGYGIDTSIASAEEVQNAINNQNKEEPEELATPNQIEEMRNLFDAERIAKILEFYNLDALEQIPMRKASILIEKARAANDVH